MGTLPQRPALGQSVGIGALYNARKDQFLPDSLLSSDMPEAAFHINNQSKVDFTTNYGDTYRKRFETLGIPSAQAGSILADSIRCGGASRYLAEPREGRSIHAALQHTVITCNQTLNFHYGELRNHLTSTTVSNPDATHIVAGIDWGSKSVISVRVQPGSIAESASADHQLQILFATFVSAVEALTGAGPTISGELPRIEWRIATH